MQGNVDLGKPATADLLANKVVVSLCGAWKARPSPLSGGNHARRHLSFCAELSEGGKVFVQKWGWHEIIVSFKNWVSVSYVKY